MPPTHRPTRIVLLMVLLLLTAFSTLLPITKSEAREHGATLIVVSQLRDGVSAASYESWVQQRNYPFVQTIPSITSYGVYRLNSAGGMQPEYVERIQVTSLDQYNRDVATNPNSAQIVGEYLSYVAVLTFVEATPIPPGIKEKGQAGAQMLVLSRLRDGVSADSYERWIKKSDYKFAKKINAITGYNVFRLTPTGEGVEPDYAEWISVTSIEQYNQEVAADPETQQMLAEFHSYVEILTFAPISLIGSGVYR